MSFFSWLSSRRGNNEKQLVNIDDFEVEHVSEGGGPTTLPPPPEENQFHRDALERSIAAEDENCRILNDLEKQCLDDDDDDNLTHASSLKSRNSTSFQLTER